MITVEEHGKTIVTTILDDTGNDEDLIVMWDKGGDFIILTMPLDNEDDQVITLTQLQALYLRDVLNNVIPAFE